MRDYKDLYSFFENLTHDIRHKEIATNGRAIVKLLPRIRANKAFDDMILGAAHAALFIGYDKGKRVIQIWGETDNSYELSVFNGETLQSSDTTLVDATDVIRVLEDYVAKLST